MYSRLHDSDDTSSIHDKNYKRYGSNKSLFIYLVVEPSRVLYHLECFIGYFSILLPLYYNLPFENENCCSLKDLHRLFFLQFSYLISVTPDPRVRILRPTLGKLDSLCSETELGFPRNTHRLTECLRLDLCSHGAGILSFCLPSATRKVFTMTLWLLSISCIW